MKITFLNEAYKSKYSYRNLSSRRKVAYLSHNGIVIAFFWVSPSKGQNSRPFTCCGRTLFVGWTIKQYADICQFKNIDKEHRNKLAKVVFEEYIKMLTEEIRDEIASS